MSRNVLNTMSSIFDALISYVDAEDEHRIVNNITRHIKAQGDEDSVIDFVKRAKLKTYQYYSNQIHLFEYKESRYLLLSEQHRSTLNEIGFDLETDIAIIQGATMLAIAEGKLSLCKEINSLIIINHCLGISGEPSDDENVIFDFSVIKSFFTPCCVAKLDDSRFPIMYEEDLNRLNCYLLLEQTNHFSPRVRSKIKNLLLLLSSRSISISITNSIQSLLPEYTFLQLYQCLEYLFKLNNSFSLSTKHNLPLEKSIEIVLAHEFKLSELDNLYQVVKNHASSISIDNYISIMPHTPEEITDQAKTVSNHIYKLRCNIAHLRYDQDDTSIINWSVFSEALIEIIYSIYEKCDSGITQICTTRNSWKQLTM